MNRPKEGEQEQKRISQHDLEQEAKKQCSMCKKRCPHEPEEKHTCPCECKIPNLRGDCVHFIDKNDTFKRD